MGGCPDGTTTERRIMDPTPMKRGRKPGPMCRINPDRLGMMMRGRKMTPHGLAIAADISPNTVTRLLAGGTTTALSVAEALATVLEVDVSVLVTE
ncbi:HTH_XRE domain containing protein [uncultured Caudovirales phage]|uniref:HTH_XRE domain containing protein n=1 Tax=uncultured Caudovirales phage TaxID=2100421 RepID=A0A6J5PB93_9CAUD|nr:HTH_XRE domain containing protein [uncultured Caudovirales phage]CAB4194820.1 HTH_XRE domain containing protein [uncultured Caudovirales phage]